MAQVYKSKSIKDADNRISEVTGEEKLKITQLVQKAITLIKNKHLQ